MQKQIFEMLEKTNQRVSLDRNFLIKEKMRVIMVEAERQERKKAEAISKKRNFSNFLTTQNLMKNDARK